MKIAVISDIHGYSIALDAVFKDIRGAVDVYLFLGDYAALGPDPIGVLDRINSFSNAFFIRGNTDRYVTTPTYPPPHVEDAQANPTLMPVVAEIARSFAWTQGAVTAAGWFDWLDDLPVEYRVTLPDGTRLLAVHAQPGRDEGASLLPTQDDAYVRDVFGQDGASLIFVGHSHWVQDRQLDGLRVINPGAVGNPLYPNLFASYVLLTADSSGCTIDFRRVEYDREAVIADLNRLRHPSAEFIIKHVRGDILPPWEDGRHNQANAALFENS